MLVGDVVRFNARRAPDAVAVVSGDRTMTYADLADRTARVTGLLRRIADRGDRVAIMATNRAEYLECYYAVPDAGMALVLVNHRLHPREVAATLEDAGATVFVTTAEHADVVDEVRRAVRSLRHVLVVGGGDVPGGKDYDSMVAAATPSGPVAVDEELAWLVYTSGTTGTPKGVMLTHRNIVTSILATAIAWSPRRDDRYLFVFPFGHVAGYATLVFHSAGAAVVLLPTFDPTAVLEQVEAHRITATSLAPTMISMVLQADAAAPRDTRSLRLVTYGASAIAPDLLVRAMDRFGPVFVQGYGLTETVGSGCVLDREDHVRGLEDQPDVLASAGRPITTLDVRVVDADMRDVVPGIVGEVVVRGDQVTKGYWGKPEETDAAFRGGWFHTRDLGRFDDDGRLSILDRMGDVIISGGENVYSREVEDVLQRHPLVAEVAVVGVPDDMWGERVCAVIVPRRGGAVTAEELVELCRRYLASFKKPRQVVFVDELPKGASGKILKKQVRASLTA